MKNESGDLIGTYNTNELRITLVWRSICFKDEKDQKSWDPKNTKFDPEEALMVIFFKNIEFEYLVVKLWSLLIRLWNKTCANVAS